MAATGARAERADSTAGPWKLDLPGTNTAVTANCLQAWWPDASGTIGGWLAGKGYTARSSLNVTHQDLDAFSNVGAFFWQTHSGDGQLRVLKKDANGNPVFNDATRYEKNAAGTNVPVMSQAVGAICEDPPGTGHLYKNMAACNTACASGGSCTPKSLSCDDTCQ